MRRALIVAGKEFRHMAHDRFTLALIVCLPIVQLIVYGYALETRIQHVPVAVLNQDSHEPGYLLAQAISRSPVFSIRSGYRTEAEIEQALRTGAIRMAIEIPGDYRSRITRGQKLGIRVWVDGGDVATSNYLLTALNALAFEEVKQQLRTRPAPWGLAAGFEIQTKTMFNVSGRTAAFLIPGLIAILVQTVTTLLVALSIATEREKGTLEQMLVTPIGKGAIVGGKALAAGAIGLAECCCLVFLMQLWFGIPILGSVLLLLAILPLLVLVPIGLGLMIAAKARTQFQALQLANVVLLPSVMLSGFVFPREFLRPPVDWLSKFVPSTYLVDLTRSIILRGTSLRETAPDVAIAAGFGIVLTALGVVLMRKSLSRA